MQPFDDIGDSSAPPGSRPWCAAMRLHAKSEINNTQSRVGNLKYTLKNIKEGEHYRSLQNRSGKDFCSWEEFVKEPWPYGLDFDPDIANAVLAEEDATKLVKLVASEVVAKTKPAAKHGGARKRGEQGSNRTLKRGETAEYLAARIKRDRPDIATAVERGEFSSMRSAAIAAGIIRKKTPLENLQAAWKKTNEEDRMAFLASIGAAFL